MSTRTDKISLPIYTRGEEIANTSSHIVGAVFAFAVLIFCVSKASFHNNYYGIVGSSIYGIMMITLYLMSSIYHGLTHIKAKKVFRVLDHCAVYLLIAGTYTPVALSAIRQVNSKAAWIILAIEWSLAIIAATLTAIDLKKYTVISMICYILMGWMIIIVYPIVIKALTFTGFIYMLVGGILYTIGAILYGLGKKRKYAHSVFHIFVLLGSVAQFLGIFMYAL